MQPLEWLRFALGGLWRQKVRTVLTVLGVAVGATSLAFSLALAVGLRKVITTEFQLRPGFWEVGVRPVKPKPIGEVPAERLTLPPSLAPARAQRLQEQLRSREQAALPHAEPIPITADRLDQIRQLPDVLEVRTFRHFPGQVRLGDASKRTILLATVCDRPELEHLLIAGRLPRETGEREVLVPELLLYELGIRSEADFEQILNQPLLVSLGGADDHRQQTFVASIAGSLSQTLTLRQGAAVLKFLQEVPQLIDQSSLSEAEKAEVRRLLQPAAPASSSGGNLASRSGGNPAAPAGNRRQLPVVASFTIVGILRGLTPADKDALQGQIGNTWHLEQAAVIAAAAGAEPLFRQLHAGLLDDGRFEQAQVRVRPQGDLPAVVAAIEGLGFQADSSLRWYTNAKREVTAIGVGLNVFSWVALVVAALGITNTLVTNVLERTREIGILKAIGATRRQVQLIFLIEGTLIGLLGGLLGVIIARVAAWPLDDYVRHEIQRQMGNRTLHSPAVFEFPLWLTLLTFSAAALTTMLAAIYPARRACRIEPIEALKHA